MSVLSIQHQDNSLTRNFVTVDCIVDGVWIITTPTNLRTIYFAILITQELIRSDVTRSIDFSIVHPVMPEHVVVLFIPEAQVHRALARVFHDKNFFAINRSHLVISR
ncbi:hypothetical protein D3C72_1567280 [compost metagenome]